MITFMNPKGKRRMSAIEKSIKKNPAMQFVHKAMLKKPDSLFDNMSPMAQGAGLSKTSRGVDMDVQRKALQQNMLRFDMMKKGGM